VTGIPTHTFTHMPMHTCLQLHPYSGLQPCSHTRTHIHIHKQVSFLSKEEAASQSGEARSAEDCLEGSGMGDALLYAYLVEDELDRLTLVEVRKVELVCMKHETRSGLATPI